MGVIRYHTNNSTCLGGTLSLFSTSASVLLLFYRDGTPFPLNCTRFTTCWSLEFEWIRFHYKTAVWKLSFPIALVFQTNVHHTNNFNICITLNAPSLLTTVKLLLMSKQIKSQSQIIGITDSRKGDIVSVKYFWFCFQLLTAYSTEERIFSRTMWGLGWVKCAAASTGTRVHPSSPL